ncbi:MAG: terpene cyclase/mutase family protein [Phycisphaerae bacterium]|nr:terpene cyclase/mutase family protein [Phycisphaerae bacterium]
MDVWIRAVAVGATLCLALGTMGRAEPDQDKKPSLSPELAAEAQKAISRGLAYLRSKQDKDGGWTAKYGPAVTAIVTKAFAQDDAHGPRHPVVRRALAYALRFEQTDGGIYERQQNLANYQTSVVLMLLSALDDPAQKPRIARAQAFLKRLQYDASESIDLANPWYGGAGYNNSKRPDLSNTQLMLESLHQSGLPADDPVYQRALTFISRCQMYDATNDQPFADGATDGGFIYTPHGGGESKASEDLQEGTAPLRSYGSMTYAGFKSMLYANVSRDDPRIKACLDWIRKHWTLDHNPNMPGKRSHEGLYYYYYVFSRAMRAWGEPVITDATGKPHNWREELCRKLVSLQRPDGSWFNERDRWLEGDPNYITGLTILSLQTALDGPPLQRRAAVSSGPQDQRRGTENRLVQWDP